MDVAVVLAEADSLADLRAKVLRSLRQQVRKGFIDRIPEKIAYIRASRADRKHLQDYLRSLKERQKEAILEWRNWRKAKLGLPSRD
ncbi:MAG TPA: hypothetical protein VMV28_05245 [Thermoplasmata archaeon]|nr:hypothetical protein [Thermoplasmata archaeon]